MYPKQTIDFTNPKRFILSLTKRGRGSLDLPTVKAAGERFVAQYQEYINSNWEAIQRKHYERDNTPDVRFEEGRRLQRSAEYIQLLNENRSSKYAIVDIGGLVQRLDLRWHTSKSLYEDEKEAVHLLNLMPLPEAVVYIYTDRQKNVERLLTRKRVLGIHKNLSASEFEAFCKKYQERWEMICGILVDRKIPLLKIDSSHKIRTSVEKINEFVENLSMDSGVTSISMQKPTILAK